MRRFLGRLLLIVLVAGITFVYPLLAPTPHRIDEAHADLITAGMTRTDVEAIFGVPAGNYDWAERDIRSLFKVTFLTDGRLTNPRQTTVRLWDYYDTPLGATWVGKHGAFTVYFDGSGEVLMKLSPGSVRITPPWERWRRWLSKQ